MISLVKNLYINIRFFLLAGLIILLFVVSFTIPFLLFVAKAALVFFLAITLVDIALLFSRHVKFRCNRRLPTIMSLGNENTYEILIVNESKSAFSVELLDELPFQFQERSNFHAFRLLSNEEKEISYKLRPITRGEYKFGNIRAYIKSNISIVERRIVFPIEEMVPVYPSIMDVKKYELVTSARLTNYIGVKRIRRIGQSYEFEQISEYQRGDNYQNINWKATSKTRSLMVNKYTDEKSQPIYSMIDKSRYMKMPFNEMSLLDYAINASLIITNSVLKKDDKAGLITFSDKVETHIKADKRRNQMSRILETLYREGETKREANYELMYSYIRKSIANRSLIFLFANFDTVYALERVLPVLRKINRHHLLVVIVFENKELEEFYSNKAENVGDIYDHTIAQKIAFEKRKVIYQLRHHAIQVIYTKPEELSINTLNKYLELKSRGMI